MKINENKGTNETLQYFSIMFKKLYESLENDENTITYDLDGADFSLKDCTIIFNKSNEEHGLFIFNFNEFEKFKHNNIRIKKLNRIL